MPDNIVEILLKLTADVKGGPLTVAEIEKVKAAATDAGKADVKASEESVKATDKAFASKQQLKSAAKGLAVEFPLLGHIARLALNPIAFITASIAASFVIWKRRVDELTRSLGGVEMPDISDDQIKKINDTAEAWGKLATKMGEFSTNATKARTNASEIVKLIQFNDAITEALGIKNPGGSAEHLAATKFTEAAKLEAEGRAKSKSAGTPGGVDAEKSGLAKLETLARAAEARKKESQANIDQILAYQGGEMNPLEKAKFGLMYALRYGPTMRGGDAINLERQNISSAQSNIDAYAAAQAAAVRRAERRAAGEAGRGMLDEAGRLRIEGSDIQRGGIAARLGAAVQGSAEAQARLAIAQAAQDVAAIAAALKEITALNKAIATELNRQRAENAATLKQVQNPSP